MSFLRSSYSDLHQFFAGHDPSAILAEYGSPLYVYNEHILRQTCKTIRNVASLPSASIFFSTKANSNPHLLRIIAEEGILADAMSPGEVAMLHAAGFSRDQILYVCNNVSPEELRFAQEKAFLVSVDSLDQLDSFGQVNPGARVMLRLNPGIGAGHHKKVITAGKETKFGISIDDLEHIKHLVAKHGLTVAGLNQHVGSLFMTPDAYMAAVSWLLDKARLFPGLEVIDFGGGFGIPYKKYDGEAPLDLGEMSDMLADTLRQWTQATGYTGRFFFEPGRYVVAESAILLGTVHAVKENSGVRYVGTDIGFSVFARPMLYDGFHDVEVYVDAGHERAEIRQTIVGNICESGDILGKDRLLPELEKGDVIGFLDAGAYGHAMSSNYTKRFRPAEVLITESGDIKLIRRSDTIEDFLSVYQV